MSLPLPSSDSSSPSNTEAAAPSPVAARGAASTLPIVGLGASAGGLEALSLFFGAVPTPCELAFVVVQHLDPTRDGLLVELLQRKTLLKVREAEDRMTVEPGNIYVIPPNRDLSLLHGILHLLEPTAPRGFRSPIDFFFRALAEDRQDRAIAVILSGMGSDGTLGLRAIKEKAGAVFVQEPTSAKFDSMPRSAIDAELADVIAPPEDLPAKIVAYLQHVLVRNRAHDDLSDTEEGALEKILILLRVQTGHDFSLYKKSTVFRRVERRMGLHQLTKISDYVRHLRESSQESEMLFKELLIGVTNFFRDRAVWEQLKTDILPALLLERPQGGILRAWTAACSTGEEAYSLAIVFREVQEALKPPKNITLQIFATDLDRDAIDKARAGHFPPNIAADVSEDRLRRFFAEDERGYRVTKEIREMVIFAPHNLVMDPPFTKLDFLTCRNLLIYFDAALQRKLLPIFHYSLKPGGILLLGTSETVGSASDYFAPLPGKTRLYRRLGRTVRPQPIEFPSSFPRFSPAPVEASMPEILPAPSAPSLQSLADQVLLQSFAPAAIMVTELGDILYINGKTGRYLEPAAGKANWNLFAMARDGLRTALIEAFHQAVRKKITVTLKSVKVQTDAGPRAVDVEVRSLTEPAALAGMVMIVFTDVPLLPERAAEAPPASQIEQTRLDELAVQLQQSRDEAQALREDMQTSQEELRSANEELQSANEELQSANEELTTSKEEMQSMNEELQTVNHELQAKLDELSEASNDMKNLLNSTGIATLFLDDALHIRRFTPQTTSIIKLIPSDAGRPLGDIVTDLEYPDLLPDAQEVLRTLIFVEKEVPARGPRWFTVRIMPYRTLENRIDGLVITFYDITLNKQLEAKYLEAQAKLNNRLLDQATSTSPHDPM